MNPATDEFQGCGEHEFTAISFLPVDMGSSGAAIVDVDTVGGLNCDSKTKKCYYKNIRLMVNNIPCTTKVQTLIHLVFQQGRKYFMRDILTSN